MKVNNTSRLTFGLMSKKDSELLFQLDQDPEVMRFINGGKLTSRKEIEEIYLPRMKSYTEPNKGWGIWKVCLLEDDLFIGWILVRPMQFFSDSPEFDNIEVGWRFSKQSWGNGYATEAAQALKKALIENGNISKLSAIAMEDNNASINIMKKLGMEYLKTDIHKDPLGDSEVVFYQLNIE